MIQAASASSGAAVCKKKKNIDKVILQVMARDRPSVKKKSHVRKPNVSLEKNGWALTDVGRKTQIAAAAFRWLFRCWSSNDEPLTDPWWLFCRQRVQPAFLHEQEWTKLTKVHAARKSWHWPVLLSCHFSPTKFLHPRPSPSRLALLILLGLSCRSAPSFGHFYAPSLHTLHGLKTLHPSSR